MSDMTEVETAAPRKGGGKLLLLAAPLAVLVGGATFYGVYSGLFPLPFANAPEKQAEAGNAVGQQDGTLDLDPARADQPVPGFLALEPIVVSLAPEATARHLKFQAVIEVDPARMSEVEAVRPRIVDVLNGFLRAVDAPVIERPAAMLRLRAQMLRRVQLVSPPGTVRDVLIQQFVLN